VTIPILLLLRKSGRSKRKTRDPPRMMRNLLLLRKSGRSIIIRRTRDPQKRRVARGQGEEKKKRRVQGPRTEESQDQGKEKTTRRLYVQNNTQGQGEGKTRGVVAKGCMVSPSSQTVSYNSKYYVTSVIGPRGFHIKINTIVVTVARWLITNIFMLSAPEIQSHCPYGWQLLSLLQIFPLARSSDAPLHCPQPH
jgi:hypothetical protein